MLSTNGVVVHHCVWGYVDIQHFQTVDEFFRYFYEGDFQYTFTDMAHIFHNVVVPDNVYLSRSGSHVAFDDNGRWISPDRLIGAYRIWHIEYYKSVLLRRLNRQTGRSRPAYGGYRAIRTHNERKMCFIDPDSIEMDILVSGRSRVSTLPTIRDDIHRHVDKCWKSQSKRSHQFK